jgi:hypothetical protein
LTPSLAQFEISLGRETGLETRDSILTESDLVTAALLIESDGITLKDRDVEALCRISEKTVGDTETRETSPDDEYTKSG